MLGHQGATRTMTPNKFVKCLDAIGWSKMHLAEQLGVSEIRARRWSTGASPIPELVEDWLERLAALHRKNPPPNIA